MKITIELTLEQEAAVSKTVTADNRDRGTERTIEELLTSDFSAVLNSHVALWKSRGLADVTESLRARADKLTDEDIADLKAVADKHATVEVAAPIEEEVK